VEDARLWGAASGTSATEHPFSLFLSRTGVWGTPPDKQLSESESANLHFKYSNEVSDCNQGWRTLAASPEVQPLKKRQNSSILPRHSADID
jgi:hypothetical protein